MITFLKSLLKTLLAWFNRWFLNININKKDFCIFSNDCWGAELYRHMNLPYNTPFVGLMMMAPCYIEFLKDPHKYIESELEFVDDSKYPMINRLRNETEKFPIGKILDIEIQFLHYESEKEAFEKWNRRKQRINWNNICVKFVMDKDYANQEHLKELNKLEYSRKVCFSKLDYPDSECCISIKNFNENGLKLFRLCMKQFDIVGWINYGRIHFVKLQKIRGFLLYYSLIR